MTIDEATGPPAAFGGHAIRTLALCFLAALLEGADIVSMGLAAPRVARAFHFNAGGLSYILTAAIVGLMVGAAVGGRLGDRVGRKRVLVVSFVAVAIFSLATSLAYDFTSFLVIRLLAGLGLGAAFPNLIALAAEASPSGRRSTGVGLMFCGTPLGGALLGLFSATTIVAADWRTIFYVGGGLPVLLLPFLILFLPESSAFRSAEAGDATPRQPPMQALFGEGRGSATTLLWVSYMFTQLIVYLINNWLPTLMVSKGFTPQQAGLISAIENFGAAAGCVVLAMVADRGWMKRVLIVTYGVMAVSLWGLGAAQGFTTVALIGVVMGFFAVGGQVVLYALAPRYYLTLSRATGVGAAIAAGRLGGITGPFAAGQLIALGLAPAAVLFVASPAALIAGAAALILVIRRPPPALTG